MRISYVAFAVFAAIAVPLATPAWALSGGWKAIDTNNDGTIELDEAQAAASAMFDKLDKDHEGTLDGTELRGRMAASEIKASNPDKKATLTKDQYIAHVASLFKAADRDHDGKLDTRELRSPPGKRLRLLLF